jgi:hypothetical protein
MTIRNCNSKSKIRRREPIRLGKSTKHSSLRWSKRSCRHSSMARRSKSSGCRLRWGWTSRKRSLNWPLRLLKSWIKRRRTGSKTVPTGSRSGKRCTKLSNKTNRNWREGRKRLPAWNKSWKELTKNSMGPKHLIQLNLSPCNAKLTSSNRH